MSPPRGNHKLLLLNFELGHEDPHKGRSSLRSPGKRFSAVSGGLLLQAIQDDKSLFDDGEGVITSPMDLPKLPARSEIKTFQNRRPSMLDLKSRRATLFCNQYAAKKPSPLFQHLISETGVNVPETKEEEGDEIMTAYFQMPKRRQSMMMATASSPKKRDDDKGVLMDQLRYYYKSRHEHDEDGSLDKEPNEFYSDQVITFPPFDISLVFDPLHPYRTFCVVRPLNLTKECGKF